MPETPQCSSECGLAFGIEVGSRFVEQQQAATCQQGLRDGDSLPLPAGKQRTALTDLGVEFVR